MHAEWDGWRWSPFFQVCGSSVGAVTVGYGRWPKERLASFNDLVDRGCDPERMSYLGGEALNLSESQRADLRKLNDELRNQFSHFKPMGWSIETAGLPRIILTAIDSAVHLMLNHPAARRHLSCAQVQQISTNVATARAALNRAA